MRVRMFVRACVWFCLFLVEAADTTDEAEEAVDGAQLWDCIDLYIYLYICIYVRMCIFV